MIPGFDMTVGRALQKLGTDAIRNNFHSDTWVLSLMARHNAQESTRLVSDVRFLNEHEIIHENGGFVFRIERTDDVKDPSRDPNHPSETALDHVLMPTVHNPMNSQLNQHIALMFNPHYSLLIVRNHAMVHLQRIREELARHEFEIVHSESVQASKERLEEHYREHRKKEFFGGLVAENVGLVQVIVVDYMLVGSSVKKLRDFVGVSNPSKCEFGQLRAMFGEDMRHNAVHASDSVSASIRERVLWLNEFRAARGH